MKNNFRKDIINNIVYIQVNHKDDELYAIVDLEDFDKINQFKTTWNANYSILGHLDGIRTKTQKNKIRTQYWIHRVVLNCPDNKEVDHINGNVLDNRKSNLRIVESSENKTNLSSYSKNKSKYTNIYLEPDGKYRVRINGQNFGRHTNIQDAIKIRNENIKIIFPLRER